MNKRIHDNRRMTAQIMTAAALAATITGCGATGDSGQTPPPFAQDILNQLTVVDLIEGYRDFNGQPLAPFADDFSAVAVAALLDVPAFETVLDELDVSDEQAAELLSVVVTGDDTAAELRAWALGEAGELAAQTILDQPGIAELAESSGLSREQLEVLLLAVVSPNQPISDAFRNIVADEVARATSEQLSSIQGLQAWLDMAGISQEQFDGLIAQTIAGGRPKAALRDLVFLGGPTGGNLQLDALAELALDPDQAAALADIQQQLQQDIDGNRAAAQRDVVDVLTPEQAARLDGLTLGDLGYDFAPGAAPSRGDNRTTVLDIFDDYLEIDGRQADAIASIRLGLRDALTNSHMNAGERFEALLDGDQWQIWQTLGF